MSNISKKIQARLESNSKVFVAYITAGDPDLESTKDYCQRLAKSGVDIIELGVPFSDPIADGPTNQRAAQRALNSNTSLESILALVAELRSEGFDTPIVLFSYLNPIFRMGYELFASKARTSGVDGVLCVDLPVEESEAYREALSVQGVDRIFLVTPTSGIERLKLADQLSSGFVYYVSRTGVTGAQASISESLEEELVTARAHIKQPLLIGFGISSADQAKEISKWGDGVVVGSSIVNKIEAIGENKADLGEFEDFIISIRSGLDS